MFPASQDSETVQDPCPILGEFSFTLNTSNRDKIREYRSYFPNSTIEISEVDLDEPNADEVTVIRYKTSQFSQGVLVDDASLEVEGVDVGVNVRWLLGRLPELTGRKATFTCLVGVRVGDHIKIYQGKVDGRIVARVGDGFGVGPFFRPTHPDGISVLPTLGEYMDPKFNPRCLALREFSEDRPWKVTPLLTTWGGPFQRSE